MPLSLLLQWRLHCQAASSLHISNCAVRNSKLANKVVARACPIPQVYEVGQQLKLDGPFSVAAQPAEVATLPRQPFSHFAYVCTKRSNSPKGM